METEYGKELNAIRKKKLLRMEDMAEVLGYSAGGLANIVHGRCKIPPGMTDMVTKSFSLTDEEIESLKKGEEERRAKEIDGRTNRQKKRPLTSGN